MDFRRFILPLFIIMGLFLLAYAFYKFMDRKEEEEAKIAADLTEPLQYKNPIIEEGMVNDDDLDLDDMFGTPRKNKPGVSTAREKQQAKARARKPGSLEHNL